MKDGGAGRLLRRKRDIEGVDGGQNIRKPASMPAFKIVRSNVTWDFHRINRALVSRMSHF